MIILDFISFCWSKVHLHKVTSALKQCIMFAGAHCFIFSDSLMPSAYDVVNK